MLGVLAHVAYAVLIGIIAFIISAFVLDVFGIHHYGLPQLIGVLVAVITFFGGRV